VVDEHGRDEGQAGQGTGIADPGGPSWKSAAQKSDVAEDGEEEGHEPEGDRAVHEQHTLHHGADDGAVGGRVEGVDDGGGLEAIGDEGESDVDQADAEEEVGEPLVLGIALADEVTDAGDEDHEKGENDEIEEDATHDVGGVVGGEIGELVRRRQAGEGAANKVQGKLDEKHGNGCQATCPCPEVNFQIIHDVPLLLSNAR